MNFKRSFLIISTYKALLNNKSLKGIYSLIKLLFLVTTKDIFENQTFHF